MAIKLAEIKKSLIEQLEIRNADIASNLALVDDYMVLESVKRKAAADIRKKGVSYEEDAASGKAKIVKQNPSVKLFNDSSRQQLAILDKLDLTTKQIIKENDNEKL